MAVKTEKTRYRKRATIHITFLSPFHRHRLDEKALIQALETQGFETLEMVKVVQLTVRNTIDPL